MQKRFGLYSLRNKTYCIKFKGFLTKLCRSRIKEDLSNLSIKKKLKLWRKLQNLVSEKYFNDQVNNKRSLAYLI